MSILFAGISEDVRRAGNPAKNNVFCIIMLKTLLKIRFFDHIKNHIKYHIKSHKNNIYIYIYIFIYLYYMSPGPLYTIIEHHFLKRIRCKTRLKIRRDDPPISPKASRTIPNNFDLTCFFSIFSATFTSFTTVFDYYYCYYYIGQII